MSSTTPGTDDTGTDDTGTDDTGTDDTGTHDNSAGGIQITGGAGPEAAAAIVAVISHLRSVEEGRRAEPVGRPHQSQWVLAGRPRTTSAPLPSHTYDPYGWSDAGESET